MVCYLKQEASSGPISFEVKRNDSWTDNIQSFELPTVFGTRTGEVQMKPPIDTFWILTQKVS